MRRTNKIRRIRRNRTILGVIGITTSVVGIALIIVFCCTADDVPLNIKTAIIGAILSSIGYASLDLLSRTHCPEN